MFIPIGTACVPGLPEIKSKVTVPFELIGLSNVKSGVLLSVELMLVDPKLFKSLRLFMKYIPPLGQWQRHKEYLSTYRINNLQVVSWCCLIEILFLASQ